MSCNSGKKWSRRTVLKAGAGLAACAAFPSNLSAAETALATNSCIDWPIEEAGFGEDDLMAASPAAAIYSQIKPSAYEALKDRALAAPSDVPGFPRLGSQAAFLNSWGIHTLRVFFIRSMLPSDGMRQIVMDQVKKWTEVCDLTFEETNSIQDSHIRVGFNPRLGHSSYVGLEAENRKGFQTMNLAMTPSTITSDYNMSVILHEFGHAMGMVHEHSSPGSTLDFNPDIQVLINYYSGKFNERPEETAQLVQDNVLKRYNNTTITKFSTFDPASIMIYTIPAAVLANNHPGVQANLRLSETDKRFAREVYGPPRNGTTTTTPGTQPVVNQPTSFTAGGNAVEVKLAAGASVELKLIVPTDQAGGALSIFTTGTTRVMLALATSTGTPITLSAQSEHGSPDLMNETIKKQFSAGEYKVTIKHPSSRGGGKFKIQANSSSSSAYLFPPNKSQ
jgi:hypothetical protein